MTPLRAVRKADRAAVPVARLAAAALAGLIQLSAAGVGVAPAAAQSAQPAPIGQPKGGSAPPAAKPSNPPTKAAPKGGEGGGGDAGLRQRVEQLEEQLVDLQVVIGTLESLARSPGAGAGAPVSRGGGGGGISAAEAGRIDGLEMQIRALTATVEQLSDRIRLSQGSGGGMPPPRAESPPPRAAAPPAFGSQTISQGQGGEGDPRGRVLGDTGQTPPPGRIAAAPPAAMPPSADGQAAKQLYEQAYGFLLQQDYASAENAFDDFLKRYPNEPLAGNAQYWLGESYFVRGQYKAAAAAFLKGYQTYARSAKAPDSLLKLAMSLDRLGQRDAACSSYGELNQRFPNAPTHVRTRADSERRRIGCT